MCRYARTGQTSYVTAGATRQQNGNVQDAAGTRKRKSAGKFVLRSCRADTNGDADIISWNNMDEEEPNE